MRFRIALVAACVVCAAPVIAQTNPLSRSEAIQAAIERGARLGVARADTVLASAQIVAAGARPNPSFSVGYSKAVPTHRFNFDIPVEFPMLRQLRIRSAELGLDAARLRFQFVRATIALDADTTYTRAVAAREHVGLSRRNTAAADSLLHMVERRRDAGDASEMDVELARINAGQQANVAIGDSLTLISSLLDLQAVLGIASERLEIRATDSLTPPPESAVPGKTLNEIAAGLSVDSASVAARLQRHSIWTLPTVSFGAEQGDPSQPGLLPTFGLAIALPIFDRNRGPIAQAEAERARTTAALTLAQVEAKSQIAHATRERGIALERVARDRLLVASADRVAAMSLIAYREGASTLANILEAQRSARDVLGQYIDDLANAWVATAELRALAISPSTSSQP